MTAGASITRRELTKSVLLVAALLLGVSCADRDFGDMEPTGLHYYCFAVNGVIGGRDGDVDPYDNIVGPDGTSFVCRCMTDDDVEANTYAEELNDEAYAVCLQDVERGGYDWSNCASLYEEGAWTDVYYDIHDGEAAARCYGANSEVDGCGVQ